MKYSYPVNKLIILGDCRSFKTSPDYLGMGFTEEHIPELIAMATDEVLLWADSDTFEVWAPVHAWRVLGLLKAKDAIEPLLKLLSENEDDDWIGNEIPSTLAKIGPEAIPALRDFLRNPGLDDETRSYVVPPLEKIGLEHTEYRDKCVEILMSVLGEYQNNTAQLNAFIISSLAYLKAREATNLMEKAFAEEKVDLTIQGDWEDVQIELGLLDERQTPAKNYLMENLFGENWEKERPLNPFSPLSAAPKKIKSKAKNKRKAAKQARKKNRKKKKR